MKYLTLKYLKDIIDRIVDLGLNKYEAYQYVDELIAEKKAQK